MEFVPQPQRLWSPVWSLSEVADGDDETGANGGTGGKGNTGGEVSPELSDGTALWFAATMQGSRDTAGGEAKWAQGNTAGGSVDNTAGGAVGDTAGGVGGVDNTAGGCVGDTVGGVGWGASEETPLVMEAVPVSALSDEALRVWLHFFAGHPMPEDTLE